MTAEYDTEDSSSIVFITKQRFSAVVQVEVEPVGKWFHTYERLKDVSQASGSDNLEGDSSEESESSEHDFQIEDNITYLRSLNPADWKSQDHYAVLGIRSFRHRANEDDIKKAYRTMVLRHHPDKRKASGEDIREDDDYFTCITRAYDTLGIVSKRRAYDSIDPEFSEDVPSTSSSNKAKFFEVFGRAFEINARWSTRKHVPMLGETEDSQHKVEKFYNFWYEFESWREFSYLDEEEKERGQDREERRWIDKQNKVERGRRKKEETSRIRKLVNNAYMCDPRIIRFKEEEKERRLLVKKAKQDAIKHKLQEEQRIIREAEEAVQRKKEEEEAEIKAKQDAEKTAKYIIKKSLNKEKRALRNFCKDRCYYILNISEKVDMMTHVELLCEALQLSKFQKFNKELAKTGKDLQAGRELFLAQVAEVKGQAEVEGTGVSTESSKEANCISSEYDTSKSKQWAPEDIQMLIKAVNLFPAGTTKRWDIVAEYLNQHSTTHTDRVAKEVLQKAKELQNSDQHMKEVANSNAYKEFEKSQTIRIDDSTASQRYDTPQEMLGINPRHWNPEEQGLLEQALKTFSSTLPDRWDKIAECIPNRSKRDCMNRYKELVERVKAKKAAKLAAGVSK